MHKHIWIKRIVREDELPCAACEMYTKTDYTITTRLLEDENMDHFSICYNCIRPFLKLLELRLTLNEQLK